MARPIDIKAESVFNNERIVGTILQYTTKNAMRNLALRLVNKTFNQECLRKVRLDHRKIEMSIGEKRDSSEPLKMTFNGYKLLELEKMKWYLKFLKDVAKAYVEELQLNPRRITSLDWDYMHDGVHQLLSRNKAKVRVFTGVSTFCGLNACADCLYYADRCREYGPLLYNAIVQLKDLGTAKHYDKLWITDSFIREIANSCADIPFAEIPNHLSALISTKITCEILCFRWAEHKGRETKIPREILEMMIRNWKVQEMRIEIHPNVNRSDEIENKWTKLNCFTTFNICTESQFVQESVGIHVKKIFLNTEFTHFLKGTRPGEPGRIAFQYYIANIRKLIPTDWIVIFTPKYSYRLTDDPTRFFLRSFLAQAHHGYQKNLTVDFTWFPTLPNNESDTLTEEYFKKLPVDDVGLVNTFRREPPNWRVSQCTTDCKLPKVHPYTYPAFYMQKHRGILAKLHIDHLNLNINMHLIYSRDFFYTHFKQLQESQSKSK